MEPKLSYEEIDITINREGGISYKIFPKKELITINLDNGTTEQVKAHQVFVYKPFTDTKLFVHKSKSGFWKLTDGTTGMRASRMYDTRIEAVEEGIKQLYKYAMVNDRLSGETFEERFAQVREEAKGRVDNE